MNIARLAVPLVALTLVYNAAEGVIAVATGLAAGSLVLLTFGADSHLEVLAAGAVLWRLSYKDEEDGERTEERAMRIIGATFLALAIAIVFTSVLLLASREGAQESRIGLLLLTASLIIMPVLALAKLWVAARTGMAVLAAEARETIACSYLSVTAFAGLLAMFLFGWWWVDPVAALLMVPWLVREGLEGVRAEACFDGSRPCFCLPCLYGVRDCRRVCCTVPCC